jgi:hypothetical protein
MADENAERGERRRRREEERRQAEHSAPAEAAPFGATFGAPEHHAPSRRELREREAGVPPDGTPQRAVPDGPAAPVSFAQGGQRPTPPTTPNARVNIPVGETEHRRRHSAEPPPATPAAPGHTSHAAPADAAGAQRRSRREMREATPSVGMPVAAPSVTGGIRRLGPDGRLTPVEPASRSAEPPARTGELPSAQARAEALRQQAARAQSEREQVERERVERERLRAAREQAERHAREQAERDRLAAQLAERERVAALERAQRERLAAEQAERQRLARERAERDRLAAEQVERERLAREQAARDAAERERAERAAREEVARQQARPETAAAPTIGDSPMTRRTARAHASVPLVPGTPGAEDPAALGRPMAAPARPAGAQTPSRAGGPWAVRPGAPTGRPGPQQRPGRPPQPLPPAERRPGQYQVPAADDADLEVADAGPTEADPRAEQYARERQARVLRERAERERVLASERERERLGAAREQAAREQASREQAVRAQAARQQAPAQPEQPAAPVDRFGTSTQGGPAVPRWSSVAETGQSQVVGRIPVESDEHAEAAETRLLRGRPSAQRPRPAAQAQQPGPMTGQSGPFGPISSATGPFGAPAMGGASGPFGAQAPTSTPFGQAGPAADPFGQVAPAAPSPAAAPSPHVDASGPMRRPEPEDVFPDEPDDDVDEDGEEAHRPRLYSWAGGLALVLVAFLLGMLIFLVVQNGAERQDAGAGAAPGTSLVQGASDDTRLPAESSVGPVA